MLMIRSSLLMLGSCAALGMGVTFSDPALADSGPTVAVEVGADVVVSDLSDDDDTLHAVGPAVALRLGYSFKAPMIRFTPEAKIAFESPGTPRAGALLGGARLNLLEVVSPAVFAHAGGLVGDIRGFVWVAGVGLDFTLIPLLNLGVYGAFYQTRGAHFDFGGASFSNRDRYEWVQFGVQAALYF
jgi:hypothetical protein